MNWLPDFTTKTGFKKSVLGALILSWLLSLFFSLTLHNTPFWHTPYQKPLMSALITWLVLGLSVEGIIWLRYKDTKEFIEKPTDYRLVFSTFWYICLAFTLLFQYDLLYADTGTSIAHGFWQAKAEFFSVFMAFLAVIGFTYAFYAKKVADSVFAKTVMIHKNMAQFFGDFEAVTDENSERSVIGLIKYARRELILYLGPPLIGYFRKQRFGSTFEIALRHKLNSDTDPLPHGFKISMICWGEEKCHEYIEASNGPAPPVPPISSSSKGPIQEETFKGLRDRLFDEIRSLSSDGRGRGQVEFHPKDYDPPVRFVIADKRKAILWILENPTAEGAAEERHKERYAAAGFATDEPHMIRILEGLYLNEIKELSRVADPPSQASPPDGA